MTKRLIIEANNVQTLVDLDETELQAYNDRQAELEAEKQAEETAKAEKDTLKASAKAKLIAGEPLTEDEANTIVL
jgi:phosphoenolpyruvate-protein kinase (PTS system EI component)